MWQHLSTFKNRMSSTNQKCSFQEDRILGLEKDYQLHPPAEQWSSLENTQTQSAVGIFINHCIQQSVGCVWTI